MMPECMKSDLSRIYDAMSMVVMVKFLSLFKRLSGFQMSTVSSLKKKCRQLEESGKWQNLSELYNKIAGELRNAKDYDEALLYYKKDRKLLDKTQDHRADAHGNDM